MESWSRHFEANKTQIFCNENAFSEQQHLTTTTSDVNSMFNYYYRQQQQPYSLTSYYNTGSISVGYQLKQTPTTLNNAHSGNERQRRIYSEAADDVGLLKVVPQTSASAASGFCVPCREDFGSSCDVTSSHTMNPASQVMLAVTESDVISNVPSPISPAQRQAIGGVTSSTVIYPWMRRRHNSTG
jgi:hypothetical protein